MSGRGQVRGRGQPAEGPLGKIFKGLASGVGLASESIHHHKEKKQAEKQQKQQQQQQEQETTERTISQDDRVPGEITSGEYDETAWQLDEAQEELSRETDQTLSTPSSSEQLSLLADNFIQTHPLTAPSGPLVPTARLQLPVVITQRRPKARDRGFVKAYAPLLQDVGIDQATFLDFIDRLNKAVEPSPWIQAINLAGLAAQHVPLAVSIAVSVALRIIANTASEVHSRTKTNSFLDQINEGFFKPRGMIALLMTWKPQDSSTITTVNFDLGTTIANASTGGSQGTFAKIQSRTKASSAATSFEFPETAPLVFPVLDKLASSTSEDPETEVKKQNIVKRGGGFVGDYLDRRAVAQWAGENPDSGLANAAPKPEFRSRYADPNHPASSGDPLAFITGGKLSSDKLRQMAPSGGSRGGFDRGSIMDSRFGAMERRALNRGISEDRRGILGSRRSSYTNPPAPYGVSSPPAAHAPYGGRDRGVGSTHDRAVSFSGGATGGIGPLSLIGGVKKLLQKDVLYLMIVNLPTEEEMALAAEYLN